MFRLLLALAAAVLSIAAQESASDRHRAATNHLRKVAAEISARSLTNFDSIEAWTAKQPEVRRQLLDMLGLDPLPKRTPLEAKITGKLDREKYRIEKIVFQSLPGLYVTGNLYIPNGASARFPAILYLCGHAPHPLGAKFNYQDRAQWFASNGYACLIIDTLEFGEVPGLHHGLHDLNMWRWLSLGYTPAGTEVWSAMRAIDYLETRPEVDSKRIGITGISGGGAITWYTAAVDERVAAAAPVCSTYTFGSQAERWRAWGQCDCIYFLNTYQIDFPAVAALIAPRPLLIISGRKDDDFPPDGYHQVFNRAQRIYSFHNATERIAEFDDEVGHSDPPQFLRAARQWMNRWLRNDFAEIPISTNAPPREAAENLAVLKDVPRDAINDQIHDLLTTRNRKNLSRDALLAALDQNVFRWFPRDAIPFETRISRNEGGWASRYGDYKEATFQTEPGVRIRAQLIAPKTNAASAPLLIYAKRPGDSIYFMDLDELLPLFGRATVLILNPRFTEAPISASEYRDIQMTASWTGRTIASMQTWDIARAIDWASTTNSSLPGRCGSTAKTRWEFSVFMPPCAMLAFVASFSTMRPLPTVKVPRFSTSCALRISTT